MPLRTAIIGLSSSATTSWASSTHLPSLLTTPGKSLFTLSALCNSSIAAAQSAIKTFNLDPSTVKAYGDPAALAADPDIDLVICATRVDKHYETILPSLRAGKSVYIEWPLAGDKVQIEELGLAARESGNGTGIAAVGLQGRVAPAVLKVKELLRSGDTGLGRLLSTEVRAFGGTIDREFLPPGLKYFADREVGGNPITIGFGHVIDYVQSVVGDIIPGTDHVHLQLQRPDIRIREPKTGEITETIRSNVPDLLSLHGTLPESPYTALNATLTAYFNRGQPYPNDPSLTWTLNCEHGTIRLTAPAGIALQAHAYAEPVTISVYRFETGEVEDVQWGWDEAQLEVSVPARSVLRSLVNLAEGREDGYVSLEDAVGRARQIGGWLDSFEI
ncbi:hypothetical protein ASPWEDRAFT_170636 [Aspergillus wentii DTO 134E9]|uniref:Uncharacterized protein n=1 Tax=Aspergillus wentii DTO 134E9 TaxID=1073089 RepID=A0A1L9RQB1_ASPWE|nr:uncharacterized protein ASPWEDRAFT_170636 [Aspergillus wentii DTO 134E9]OJJ37150.1 hypothetical protein ASPWEDRAFT_170636 [Aspergillus wentii DTO 134E9]